MSRSRRLSAHAANAATRALAIQQQAPWIAARRLLGLQGATPLQAWFSWQRWSLEKAFAFQAANAAVWQESTRALLRTWLGARPPTMHDALAQAWRSGAKGLAPVHRRVARNARTAR